MHRLHSSNKLSKILSGFLPIDLALSLEICIVALTGNKPHANSQTVFPIHQQCPVPENFHHVWVFDLDKIGVLAIILTRFFLGDFERN